MSEHKTPKKPTQDWHRADIVAAVRKAGWTLRKLSVASGYSDGGTLKTALDRPWPKGERLIAEAIGVNPAVIWPSRYRGGKDTARATKKQRAPQEVAA